MTLQWDRSHAVASEQRRLQPLTVVLATSKCAARALAVLAMAGLLARAGKEGWCMGHMFTCSSVQAVRYSILLLKPARPVAVPPSPKLVMAHYRQNQATRPSSTFASICIAPL